MHRHGWRKDRPRQTLKVRTPFVERQKRLPLGLALVVTDRGGIAESRWVNRGLGAVVNAFRSL